MTTFGCNTRGILWHVDAGEIARKQHVNIADTFTDAGLVTRKQSPELFGIGKRSLLGNYSAILCSPRRASAPPCAFLLGFGQSSSLGFLCVGQFVGSLAGEGS